MATEPAWLDPDELESRMGTSLSGAALVTLKAIMAGVEASIQAAINSPVLAADPATLWLASSGHDLIVLPLRPVNLNYTFTVSVANKPYDTANALLLTEETDWDVAGDASPMWGGTNYRGSAMLRRLGSVWPPTFTRIPTRLAPRPSAQPRIVYIDGIVFGWNIGDIPQSIFEAGYAESAVRYNLRSRGQLLQSESLNGYSYSLAATGQAAQAAIATLPGFQSDTARAFLTPYMDLATNAG